MDATRFQLKIQAMHPDSGHDPIRNLLRAAEALEELSTQAAREPSHETVRSAASQRLDRAIEHLRELGAPEEEILALAGRRWRSRSDSTDAGEGRGAATWGSGGPST